jgi:hypothetical protein
MNAAILRDRDCWHMVLEMFHMRSGIIWWHEKNQWKAEIAFPLGKEWNESEHGMVVSRVSKSMNTSTT